MIIRFAALLATLAAVAAVAALSACGGGDGSTNGPLTGQAGEGKTDKTGADGVDAALEFEADPGGALAYTTDEATAQAGDLTIHFTNPSGVSHDVRIEGPDGKDIGGSEVVSEGSDTSSATLKPGEYTFFCSLPGHRQGGMEGSLKVE